MNQSIILDPFLPLPLLIASVVISVLAGLFFMWRAGISGLFRGAAMLLIVGALANPQIQSDERTPLDDIVLVIRDISASQTLDRRQEINDLIAAQLDTALGNIGGVILREVDLAGEQETRFVENLSNVLADIPRAQLSAIFIITDGQMTDIQLNDDNTIDQSEAVQQLLPETVPVHVLLTGQQNEVDRRIVLQSAPRYGIVRESVRVSFRIEDIGPNNQIIEDGGSVVVRLRLDGKEILQQTVPTGRDVGFDVPLERPGNVIIELIADERPGELTTRNNLEVLPITAVRDRLRVLLISGEPNPGERVWRNLLKSDPAIDLVHFTILRTAEKLDTAGRNELALIQFPTDVLFLEKLSEFDLVIFDRYTWRNVLKSYHFDNIARFVEQGGAMLIASGPEYNGVLSLARRRTISYLLPSLPLGGTIEKPFRPTLTDDGKRHPVTADLPGQEYWGRWVRAIPTQLRSGRTLITGPDGTPILILDRVGEGRVGMIQSDHIWLWARGFDGGGPHAELLRRTAHWLMKEPQLEEESLLLVGDDKTLTVSRQSMRDQPDPVTLTLPDGTTRELTLDQSSAGLFVRQLNDMSPGLYRANSDSLFAIGAVGIAAAPEFTNVVTESRKLQPIAAGSGGGIYTPRTGQSTVRLPAVRRVNAKSGSAKSGNAKAGFTNNRASARAGPGWAGILTNKASQLEGRSSGPFAPPWVWLMLIAACLACAWGLESRTDEVAD